MGGGDEEQQVGDHVRKQQVGDSSHPKASSHPKDSSHLRKSNTRKIAAYYF